VRSEALLASLNVILNQITRAARGDCGSKPPIGKTGG